MLALDLPRAGGPVQTGPHSVTMREKAYWHHRHSLMERDRDLKDAEIASLRARLAEMQQAHELAISKHTRDHQTIEELRARLSRLEGAAQVVKGELAQVTFHDRYFGRKYREATLDESEIKRWHDALDRALTGEEPSK